MVIKIIEPIAKETLDEFIVQAAKSAGYEEGFGIKDCALGKPIWWAAYCRQSLDEQGNNNRLPDYLRTCALEAKRLAAVVPREYILFDLMTGEHLERPKMIFLRKLMAERRIAGVIFPALDRLSREPLHQQIFELEAAHYGVLLQYADAPSGNDPGSQFARTILAHAAKLVKIANRRNNRGGNIGRVVNKNVPAGKTPYGYRYKAEYEEPVHGRRKLISASWLVDSVDTEGKLVHGSEAWIVTQVFQWIGIENRTLYWVAKKLNEMAIKPRYATEWSPAIISFIVKNHCYTGHHVYNKAMYVPNPNRPIGDFTYAIKRTVRQIKPESEWAQFEVPPLVPEKLWDQANLNLTERGRGKGKEGKRINALARGRIYCPSCNRLMSIYQDSNYHNLTYYICTSRFQGWRHKRCHIHSLRIDRIDNVVWDCVYALLKQPEWVYQELSKQETGESTNELQKRIRLEQQKIERLQYKIRRIQDGYEADPPVYTTDEVIGKIGVYRDLISHAETEIHRLDDIMGQKAISRQTREEALQILESIRDTNLEKASFEEKRNLIAKLGIKVYPSEDGKVVRISSTLQFAPSPLAISPQKINIASVMLSL